MCPQGTVPFVDHPCRQRWWREEKKNVMLSCNVKKNRLIAEWLGTGWPTYLSKIVFGDFGGGYEILGERLE